MRLYVLNSAGSIASTSATFGHGGGPILLNNVQCTGIEAKLLHCTSGVVVSSCYHSKDAGVRCHVQTGIVNDLAVRQVN